MCWVRESVSWGEEIDGFSVVYYKEMLMRHER